MSAIIRISRAGPLTSIQDDGRFGMLRHGISASGPMDRTSYLAAGQRIGAGMGGVEFTMAGLELKLISGGNAASALPAGSSRQGTMARWWTGMAP